MKYRTNQLTKHPPGLLHCRHEAPGAGGPHKQLRDHQDPAGQRGQSTLSSPPQVPGELAVPTQHFTFWFRCGCEDCSESRGEDSLRHSRRRINAYRALASPSLIALSSKDPILTAFKLSWELRELAFAECEFKSEYMVCVFFLNICFISNNLILELKKTMSRFRDGLTGSHSQFLWVGSDAQLRPRGSSLHSEWEGPRHNKLMWTTCRQK